MSDATASARSAWKLPVQSLPRPSRPFLVRAGIVAASAVGCLVTFLAFAAWQGAEPLALLQAMVRSAFLDPGALTQTLVRTVPIGFAALAVAIPARAGLVNVGGEGQLILGAVAATGVGLAVAGAVPGPLSIVLSALAGAVTASLWALIPGLLRVWFGAAEAVTTLLMNFIAIDILLFLIYASWKDPLGTGQPQSAPLPTDSRLALFGGAVSLNVAVVLLVVTAIALHLVFTRTSWGFKLRVAGGNPDAAQRAGLAQQRLMLSAMLAGGALAGLGGAFNLLGIEGQLRPGITTALGYTAFLACFVARSNPLAILAVAFVFSAIRMGGNGLRLTAGLDGNAVNVALALIVVGVLLVGRRRTAS